MKVQKRSARRISAGRREKRVSREQLTKVASHKNEKIEHLRFKRQSRTALRHDVSCASSLKVEETYARRLHLLEQHKDRHQVREIGCDELETVSTIINRDVPNSRKRFMVERYDANELKDKRSREVRSMKLLTRRQKAASGRGLNYSLISGTRPYCPCSPRYLTVHPSKFFKYAGRLDKIPHLK